MWIDDRLVVDEWREGSNRGITADYGLAEGMHTVRVEFYERIGDAMIDVWWEKVDQQSSFADWKGEYWPNRNLAGDPTVIRNDRTIDFEWGSGAAAPGLPSDRFSARWTRKIDFEPATYRIYARADDGVRVWVDDNRVIDQWQDSPGWEVYRAEVRLDGRQRIKVEYYDRTGNALVEVWWQKLTDPPTTTPTAPVATPEPTPTEAIPTDTPEPEPTDTPEPTPTIATPTDTPEPTPTDRPEPQVSAVQNVESGNVEVVGSGFAQGTRLFVYLTMPDGARMPESIATAEADDGGQVNLTFAMPATWPDGTPVVAGPVTLMVATEDGAIELSTQLEYTPMQGPA